MPKDETLDPVAFMADLHHDLQRLDGFLRAVELIDMNLQDHNARVSCNAISILITEAAELADNLTGRVDLYRLRMPVAA
jgi:hypothetical protein